MRTENLIRSLQNQRASNGGSEPAQHPGGGAGKFGLTNVQCDVVKGQSDPAVARPVEINGVYRIFLVKRKLSSPAAEPANNIERELSWRNAFGINF